MHLAGLLSEVKGAEQRGKVRRWLLVQSVVVGKRLGRHNLGDNYERCCCLQMEPREP